MVLKSDAAILLADTYRKFPGDAIMTIHKACDPDVLPAEGPATVAELEQAFYKLEEWHDEMRKIISRAQLYQITTTPARLKEINARFWNPF